MRKIIDGKMYDTNTATRVGDYERGNGSDLYYLCEELYIKKTKEWFLYGEGGARSIYSEQCDSNSWCGGAEIIPYSPEDAKKWLSEHDFVDEYIEYFGEPEE